MIVVDASVLIETLLLGRTAAHVFQALREESSLHVPELVDLEVAQVLRRYERRRDISRSRAENAMVDYRSLGLVRHSISMFLPRIWQLRNNMTAYDACYVALAESLDAVVLTLDARLASAVGTTARIRLIAPGEAS